MSSITRPGLAEMCNFRRVTIYLLLFSVLSLSSTAPLQYSVLPNTTTRCVRYYVVSAGDRLSRLSARYNVSTQALAEANGISTSTPLPHGYVLCIPYKPLDWYFPQAVLNAYASFNRLTVWGSGFPAEHRFNIRIKAYLGSKTRKVGNILIDEDGQFQAFPRIPKEFDKARILEVCLKDNNESYRICTRIRR